MMWGLVRRPWSWAALAVFLIVLYHTARLVSVALAITATLPSAEADEVALRPLPLRVDSLPILEAVELDPFREDRTAAAARYRLPGDSHDTEQIVEEEAPVVILLGTVLSSDGSGFALCQSGDEPPRLVRLGQSIGGLTLKRVAQARATFAAADGSMSTLSVSRGGAP